MSKTVEELISQYGATINSASDMRILAVKEGVLTDQLEGGGRLCVADSSQVDQSKIHIYEEWNRVADVISLYYDPFSVFDDKKYNLGQPQVGEKYCPKCDWKYSNCIIKDFDRVNRTGKVHCDNCDTFICDYKEKPNE